MSIRRKTDLLQEVVDIGHHLLGAIPRQIPWNVALGQEHHHARRHVIQTRRRRGERLRVEVWGFGFRGYGLWFVVYGWFVVNGLWFRV